ncbi:MAG: DNA recombination protein RmuC [Bacillota bacterium]|nr:DNA recombination protein RmuC [Bacillota bacterium]
MQNALLAVGLMGLVLLSLLLLRRQTAATPEQVAAALAPIREALDRDREAQHEALASIRTEMQGSSRATREEVTGNFRAWSGTVTEHMTALGALQKDQLSDFAKRLTELAQSNDQRMTALREVVDRGLKEMREDNAQQLEQMRATVDEKLQTTLETRLGESFKQVSASLEQVFKGLGEMQVLASSVGDLKKVLTNVKTRGIWGEVQLESILNEILTPDQYAKNVQTKAGSSERVEFAVKLPGNEGTPVWLPIDAKFPQEDYHRLLDAQDRGDLDAYAASGEALEKAVLAEANRISTKYLDPPNTTDFAILFLPVEGLYAEVLRRPGLSSRIQNDHKVNVTGPTTFAALVNCLRMGFRTLAIERRSSEVWRLLGAIKTDFGKFGDLLDKTKKKLQEAANSVDSASTKTRAIQRHLRGVEQLPADEALRILPVAAGAEEAAESDAAAALDQGDEPK